MQIRREDRSAPLGSDVASGIEEAARLALARRLPLVAEVEGAGLEVVENLTVLDTWGRALGALAAASGIVPVVMVVDGPALSATALALGLADAVVMTADALAYVSGPAAVSEVTGMVVEPSQLGGPPVHASRSGVATLVAHDPAEALALVAELLDYLPPHCDELPPMLVTSDPVSRPVPELRDLVPATATGSYDVRRLLSALSDDGEVFELKAAWAPQLVTALIRVGGQPVGALANQPEAMAGTLDIAASQKGARFVSWCDAFNVPLLTVVDTPGFMPGRDLEWRGMIRHGAELVYAYAEATVPRVCLVVRKAYGGAYIVMDSKAMGNDVCIAWPSAELAVMGAEGAVQVIHRRASEQDRAALAEQYRQKLLNPYIAAERGYVDVVIDPAETRQVVARCLDALQTKREMLVRRKHGNRPL